MRCYIVVVRRRLSIAITVLVSAHLYIWWRFIHVPHWPLPVTILGTILLLVMTPSLPIGTFGLRHLPREEARPYRWLTYTTFGWSVYLLLAAGVTHVAIAIGVFEVRTAAVVGAAAATLTIAYGLLHVARGPQVKRVCVPIANLPPAAEGYTIVQLTDVHIGAMLGREFAAAVVEQVNALHGDAIVITGDFIDGRFAELKPHVEPFRELRAIDGVFAVTGNHEYYWETAQWLAHLRSFGFCILRNEHVSIRGWFTLAGVDDSTASEDVPAALAGRDPELPVVLLAHHPSTIARARLQGVDLQLSGHTHGGQLLPLGWLSRWFEPLTAGLRKFGGTWLYVSEGTGFWGPPLRVGTTSEITLITLARA